MLNKDRPYPFETAEPSKLAWLAGLLQAEANFTMDARIRSKSNDPNYRSPPPIPRIKLEMVEKDVMEHVGELLGQNVVIQNRKTRVNKTVYRVSLEARDKTEVFLRAILPYIVGEKNRSRVIQLLEVCDAYNKWLAARSKKSTL